MTLWLAAVGFVSMLGQVVLLRELLVAYFGSELILLLSVGILLLASSLGVMGARWLGRPSGAHVRGAFLALALLLPLLVIFVRAVRLLFGGTRGAYLPIPQQALGLLLALLPFGMVTGALFQRAAVLFVARGRTLARAYAVESAGGLAGGVLATVSVMAGMQNLTLALACALTAVAAGSLPRKEERLGRLAPPAGVLGAALLVALAFSGPMDLRLSALNHPALLAARDTPYGRVVVEGSLGQVMVFENDALAAESQGTTAEEFVHLAALQVVNPLTVLVLGGCVEGLVGEVLKQHLEKVDAVELDGAMLALVEPRLPPETRASLRDPSVRLIVSDPRAYIKGAGTYDLILVAMPEPASGQANRYYTREFFDLCGRHMREGGILALRLPAAENLWSPALALRTASIHKALREVFADVLVLPGNTSVVLASKGKLARDPVVLSDRWRQRGIHGRLVSPEYIRYILTNDRLAEIAGILAKTRAPENTDARPVCYAYTLLLWLSRFYPSVGLMGWSGRELSPAWLLLPTLLWGTTALAARRSAAVRSALLVGCAGFSGMVLEGAILLAYQTARGVLYQDLGLLLTCFMGGLCAGALAVEHFWGKKEAVSHRPLGVSLTGALAGLGLICAGFFHFGFAAGLAGTAALLFAAGALTGGPFAYAGLCSGAGQQGAVAPLYAADLLGGCIGSIAGGLVLMPLVGMTPSSLLVVGVALASLALI